jgi:hypothetical protein
MAPASGAVFRLANEPSAHQQRGLPPIRTRKYFAGIARCFQLTFLKSVSDWKVLALLACLI